jgi:DNA-binding transcriptional ArsR family regulator
MADENAVFAALGDPTRRRLLDRLSTDGPLTATELAPDYPMSRQAVVKHLGALAGAGLLVPEREGRDVRYRVHAEAMGEAAKWMADVTARWDRRLAALDRRVRSESGEDPAG